MFYWRLTWQHRTLSGGCVYIVNTWRYPYPEGKGQRDITNPKKASVKTGVPGSSGGEDRCVRHAPPASLQHFAGEGTRNQWSHSTNSERAESGFLTLWLQGFTFQTTVTLSAFYSDLSGSLYAFCRATAWQMQRVLVGWCLKLYHWMHFFGQ